jgi:hypothetical protein
MTRHLLGLGLVGLVALFASSGCATRAVIKQNPLEAVTEETKVGIPQWEGEVRMSANDDQDFDRPGSDSELLAVSLQRMMAGEGVKARVHCVRVGGSLGTSAAHGVGAMHARVKIDFLAPATEDQRTRVLALLASLAPASVAAPVAIAPEPKPELEAAAPSIKIAVGSPSSAALAKAAQAR